MATCKHENQYLMGTNKGIVCRKCGALFSSFDELNKAQTPAEADEPKQPAESTAKKTTTRKARKQA